MKVFPTMKESVLVLMTLMAMGSTSQESLAQSVLDNLTFEAPVKWLRPTGTNVNVRKSPAANAAKVDMVSKSFIYPVLDENDQWYKTTDPWVEGTGLPVGWVSKKVSAEAEPAPITVDMLNRYFGWSESYEDWEEWTVSTPVGKHGLTLMYITGCNAPHSSELWLGKQVGNVFVFKYRVTFIIREDPDGPDVKKLQLNKESIDGELRYNLYAGANYLKEMKHGTFTAPSLDLTKFTDKTIEAIFGDEIRAGRAHTIYVTADRLSGSFKEYELG